MDFSFDDTQSALRDLAREVFSDKATTGVAFDSALWRELEAAGLSDVGIGDGGLLEQCVLLVEQGRAVASVPLWTHLVAGLPGGMTTLAVEGEVRVVDGGRLEGTMSGVPAMKEAGRVVVVTGGGVFVTPTAEAESETRTTTAGFDEYDVTFRGAKAEALDRDPSDLRRRAVVALCAIGVGVAERALELTASYVSERRQFGKPLGTFQAVQQRAADAYIDVEAMRATMWQAAWRISEGLEAEREVSIAKFWASEGGQRVVSAAQHLHGGMGSDVDYPLHRYTLWSKWVELSFGAATPTLAEMGSRL